MELKQAFALGRQCLGRTNLVRIDAADGIGALTSGDGEAQLILRFPTGMTGSFAVSGRVCEVVAALPDEGLEIKATAAAITVASPVGHYRFKTLDPASVPVVAEEAYGGEMQIGCARLRAGLQFVAEAAAERDIRYYLNGVHARIRDASSIVLEASNAHLAARCVVAGGSAMPWDGILPNRSVRTLVKLLDTEVESVTARFIPTGDGNGPVRWEIGTDIVLITKMIDGVYPEIARVIDGYQPTAFATAGSAALLTAIDRLGLTVDERAPCVSFKFEGRVARLSTPETDERSGTEDVAAVVDEAIEGSEARLDIEYARKAIAACGKDTQEVALGLANGAGPLTLRPNDSDRESIWVVAQMTV